MSVRIWFFIFGIFTATRDLALPNETLWSPLSESEAPAEQGECFRIASENRECKHGLPTFLTKEMCCCTVGKAWGPNCEQCPQVGTGE